MTLIPIQLVDTYRKNLDVMIDIYGFPVQLFVPLPNVIAQREGLDIYQEKPHIDTEDHYYNCINTKAFVEWKPDDKRLRRLGVFVEGSIPIIAWFKNIPELTRDSYFKMDINYIEGSWGTDEFQIVDRIVKARYDAVVLECYNVAPRRK